MDPSIMKLLEEDEDESMHSGADVEAFTAALNRDIEGAAGASGSHPSGSSALSQESNQTSAQMYSQWQRSNHNENKSHQSQQQELMNQEQREKQLLEMEMKEHVPSVEVKRETNQAPSVLPMQYKPMQADGKGYHIEQNSGEFSQSSASMQMQVSGTVHTQIREPERILNPGSESQFSNMQRFGNQPVPVPLPEQVGNSANRAKKITFGSLLPIILPELDKDRAAQLQSLYAKLLRNEIPKDGFVRNMRTIVGDRMLRLAVVKMQAKGNKNPEAMASQFQAQSQNPMQQQQQLLRPTGTSAAQFSDPYSFGQLHQKSQNTPGMTVPSRASAPVMQPQKDSADSHGLTKEQLPHLHFPQSSFPMYGVSGYNPYPGTNVSTSSTMVRPQPHDPQLRQVQLHQGFGSTNTDGTSQGMNVLNGPKVERPSSYTDPRVLGSTMTNISSASSIPHNSVTWQPMVGKEKNVGALPSMGYVKQEPVDHTHERQQKPAIFTSQGPTFSGALQSEQGKGGTGTPKDEASDRQHPALTFPSSDTDLQAQSQNPMQQQQQLLRPTGTSAAQFSDPYSFGQLHQKSQNTPGMTVPSRASASVMQPQKDSADSHGLTKEQLQHLHFPQSSFPMYGDESMHSGADVEAFTAALNRDIEGAAGASGSHPSGSSALSQESNQTSAQMYSQWQRSNHNENKSHQSQQQELMNQEQREKQSLEMEMKEHVPSVEVKRETNQAPSVLPMQYKPMQADGKGYHIEQNSGEFSQSSASMQMQVSGTVHTQIREPERILNPGRESQFSNMQRFGNQPVPVPLPEQVGNSANRAKQIPFGSLLPIILPELDKDRAAQLQSLYAKLLTNEIPKDGFVRNMRTIVGDRMLRLAVVKMQAKAQSQNPMQQQQQLLRPTGTSAAQFSDPYSFGQLHQKSQNTPGMTVPSRASAPVMQPQKDSADSHGLAKEQLQHLHFPQSSFPMYGGYGRDTPGMTVPSRASASVMQPQKDSADSHGLTKEQLQHLHFPQSSFPMYGDESMHSGADVEAFTAALNRDIEGAAGASGSHPSGSSALSQESNQTSAQMYSQWQRSNHNENKSHQSQQQELMNQEQREKQSLEMEMKEHVPSVEVKRETNQAPSVLPMQYKPMQADGKGYHIEQNSGEFSQSSASMQMQVSGTVHTQIREPERILNPGRESQFSNMQRFGNQPVPVPLPEQVGNSANRAKQIPFGSLLPIILPELDKDRAAQLQSLYAKLLTNEIPKDGFVRNMRTIVGDRMLRLAVVKMQAKAQSQNPMQQQQQLLRPTGTSAAQFSDPYSFGQLHQKSQNTPGMTVPSRASAPVMQPQKDSADSHGLAKEQLQHLHFPQSSFPMYGEQGRSFGSFYTKIV